MGILGGSATFPRIFCAYSPLPRVQSRGFSPLLGKGGLEAPQEAFFAIKNRPLFFFVHVNQAKFRGRAVWRRLLSQEIVGIFFKRSNFFGFRR